MKWVQTIMKFTSKKTRQSKRINLIKKFALNVLVPAGKDVSNTYFQKIIKKNKRTTTLLSLNNHLKNQLLNKGLFLEIKQLKKLSQKQHSRLI